MQEWEEWQGFTQFWSGLAGGEFRIHFLFFLTSIWQRRNGKREGAEAPEHAELWIHVISQSFCGNLSGAFSWAKNLFSHSRHCLDVPQPWEAGVPLGTWESRCRGQWALKEPQNDCALTGPLLCCPWCLLVLQKDIPQPGSDATFLRMSRCCWIPVRGQGCQLRGDTRLCHSTAHSSCS